MTTTLALAAILAIAAPDGSEARTVRLAPRQEVVLEETAATAAWAVDPEVVETALRQGRVTVVGRSAGTTVVSVMGSDGVRSYEVVVDAPRPKAAAGGSGESEGGSTAFQGGYDSSTTRATASLDVIDRSRGRVRRFHLTGVARRDREGSAEAPVSLPYLSFELSSPGRELVLFDRFVEHSPLTVNNVSVRGAHLRRGALLVHAGLASSLLYDDLILPGRAEGVAGVGYELSRGRFTLTPSAFVFPSETLGGERGAVGSLTLARGRESDPFRLRTEIGYGGRWGGAADLALDSGRNRLRVQVRHQPRGFASLGLGAARGTFAEGAWTGTAGRMSLNATASVSRYGVPFGTQRSDATGGTARFALAKDLFLTGGASLGWFDTAGGGVRALSIPAGFAYEGRRGGASLLYRYQENTGTNHGGSGGRLGLRAGGSRLRGSVFVDGQREAPTVDFTLREEPRLQRLLAEQGLTAQTPEDVARILSLYAPLEGQGYLQGVSVNVHPWRLQAGGDLALLLQKNGRQQLRFHFLVDRTRTVARRRETTLASASYARYVAGAEVAAGYTWSSSDIDGWVNQGSSFQVTLRKRFDGVPRLPGMGGGAITGLVFADEDAKGDAKGMPPRAGTQVRLDGSRLAVTDERGRFRFGDVSPGPHTVEAILPSAEDTFFTTPSAAVVQAGAAVGFGLSRTPARLVGSVRDDAGRPMGAVALRLQGESRKAAATSDSAGRFVVATAEGEYVAAIDAESLPAGYDAASARPARVQLRRGEAVRLEMVVSAHRALSGRVLGNGAEGAEVRLVELGRTVAAGPDGGYAFRNLKPGTYTVAATASGRTAERAVLVPEGPALLRDVDLDLSASLDTRALADSGLN
jgi:hypothetical protein